MTEYADYAHVGLRVTGQPGEAAQLASHLCVGQVATNDGGKAQLLKEDVQVVGVQLATLPPGHDAVVELFIVDNEGHAARLAAHLVSLQN